MSQAIGLIERSDQRIQYFGYRDLYEGARFSLFKSPAEVQIDNVPSAANAKQESTLEIVKVFADAASARSPNAPGLYGLASALRLLCLLEEPGTMRQLTYRGTTLHVTAESSGEFGGRYAAPLCDPHAPYNATLLTTRAANLYADPLPLCPRCQSILLGR
jgi:hypothetical protein